jgi:hypothetical protein
MVGGGRWWWGHALPLSHGWSRDRGSYLEGWLCIFKGGLHAWWCRNNNQGTTYARSVLLQSLGIAAILHRPALYADDLIPFAKPLRQYLLALREIFSLFEGASGLGCNLAQCQLISIHCSEDQTRLAVEAFPCQLGQFPIKYLGMPLSVWKLPKSSWQPMINRVADKLLPWKGQLLNQSGRLELIRSTLTAMAVYIAICIGFPPWVIKALEKILKAFLWSGMDVVQGGKCLLSWKRSSGQGTWEGLEFSISLAVHCSCDGCGSSILIALALGHFCHSMRMRPPQLSSKPRSWRC